MSTPNVTFYKQATPVTTEGAITFDPTNLQITVGTGTQAQIVASSRPDTTLGTSDTAYYLTGVEYPDSTSDPQTLYCDPNESIYFNNSLLHAPSLSCESLAVSNNGSITITGTDDETTTNALLNDSSLSIRRIGDNYYRCDLEEGGITIYRGDSSHKDIFKDGKIELASTNSFNPITIHSMASPCPGVYLGGSYFNQEIIPDYGGIVTLEPEDDPIDGSGTFVIPGILLKHSAISLSSSYGTCTNVSVNNIRLIYDHDGNASTQITVHYKFKSNMIDLGLLTATITASAYYSCIKGQ